MVITSIAANRLTTTTRTTVERLLAVQIEPLSALPRTNTLITAACWADDVKDAKGTGVWHYKDIPITLDGTTTHPITATMDVVRAINNAKTVLRAPGSSDAQKAEMLRYLLHFVGDIHQPLHCTSMFSANHPNGDAGGNSFHLTGAISNLHYLWDDGMGYLDYPGPSRPLSSASQTKIGNMAKSIMAANPATLIDGASMDPTDWLYEGAHIAKTVVYVGIQEESTPSADYIARGWSCTQQRVAIAGYRLARLLNELFDPPIRTNADRSCFLYTATAPARLQYRKPLR